MDRYKKTPEKNKKLLSIIIPLAPFGENLAKFLIELEKFPYETEIIFVSSQVEKYKEYLLKNFKRQYKLIPSKSGRGACMNTGAENSKGEYLLFLHVDSRLDKSSIEFLLKKLEEGTKSILYFDLIFEDKTTFLLRLNEVGVLFRSRMLKCPFGDQGLCFSRSIFFELGSYKTNLSYGEDHILIKEAIHKKIKIESLKRPIYTSARKYIQNGWFKTTTLHLYLWIKQGREYKHNKGGT